MSKMRYVGDISNNSSILLEILTYDSKNNPVTVDTPIEAHISKQNEDGLTNVSNVILNKVEKCQHQYLYDLSELKEGMHFIDYTISINGNVVEKREGFFISNTKKESIIDNPDEEYGDKPKYIISSDFQESAEIEVNEEEVIIHLDETEKSNCSYSLVITDAVKAIDGSRIKENTVVSYTTSYTPLYAEPLEVKSLLKDVFFYFSIESIYDALRSGGQRAHQLLRMPADANHPDFELIEEDDDILFPASKFSSHYAALKLLNQLVIKIVYAEDENESIIGKDETLGGFALGDFSVSGGSSAEKVKAEDLPEITVVKELIAFMESELKFWQDALMGRNARGYAAPVSASNRGDAAVPESREI